MINKSPRGTTTTGQENAPKKQPKKVEKTIYWVHNQPLQNEIIPQ
jgi:hypothetical protein